MHTSINSRPWANKVPQVTLLFWIIKMMSTTVGETGADYLDFHLKFGLVNTSILMGVITVFALVWQLRTDHYQPFRYWFAVVMISIFGTLITDLLTDKMHVPLLLSTACFTVLLAVTFTLWFRKERTLSIAEIDTPAREGFYWLAILTTFALGTAAGDWISEGQNVGYAPSALLFGGLIAAAAALHYLFKVNAVTCFWVAYVLTRPLGASCGDLLSKSAKHGGLGYGTINTSLVFLGLIVTFVIYLHFKEQTVAKEPV